MVPDPIRQLQIIHATQTASGMSGPEGSETANSKPVCVGLSWP